MIRIISKLDIKNGYLIKGINLEGLRVLGEPYDFAQMYYKDGIDEVFYVDNVATLYGTNNLSKFIRKTAKNLFVPLAIGGGIKSIKDAYQAFQDGADKIVINSAAIINPKFISNLAKIFGSANICVSIETIKYDNKYFISRSNGRDLEKVNPFEWARKVQNLGAGEICLTSVNHEGIERGFDLKLYERVSKSISIPILAHGGCGNYKHVYEVIKNSNVSGVVLSSLLHYNYYHYMRLKQIKTGNISFITNNFNPQKKKINHIKELKKYLNTKNISTR